MNRVRLGSAAIPAVNYDKEQSTLDVEFREGETYRYLRVPEFVYRELLKAESAGKFCSGIKDQFEYVKLDWKLKLVSASRRNQHVSRTHPRKEKAQHFD